MRYIQQIGRVAFGNYGRICRVELPALHQVIQSSLLPDYLILVIDRWAYSHVFSSRGLFKAKLSDGANDVPSYTHLTTCRRVLYHTASNI